MKRLISTVTALLALLALAGCQSAQPKSMDEVAQVMQVISDFARTNDMAAVFTGNYSGRTGVYAEQQFGVATGVQFAFTVQANAADVELAGPTDE